MPVTSWCSSLARGLQPERLRLVLVHPEHGRGTVGDLRRRARGVLVALDDRLELRERLHRRVAQALVARDHLRLAGRLTVLAEDRRLDRRDLALEAALVPRLLRLALRVEAPLVEVLTGDAAVVGDALGGAELAVGRVVLGPRLASCSGPGPLMTFAPSGTWLICSTPHAIVMSAPPAAMRPGGEVVGLLRRAALGVDRGARGLVRRGGRGRPRATRCG